MIIADQELVGRAALLAATGHHPFARHVIRPGARPRGWRREGLVAWLLASGTGPVGGAIGACAPAVDLFAALATEGALHRGHWVQLPRTDPETLAGRFTIARLDEWDFLWTDAPPPPQADEERVVRLTAADHPALAALIDEAFPSTTSRPGDPGVVDWYGIRDGDRIVACGADRSRGDIGFLAGLTVAPHRRGRGLGAALTAGMTRALAARYDRVALGVYTHNVGAVRLYRRLGFTGTLARSSVQLG
ncbi:GNAT family N-acetyltransferase [Micromonospora halophytica]|uniref:FR47-like protein n=1 Tax=Micromonospora halophytica TaxID=47864 RepID=A0A1C5J1P4_9ACTN|nr:GNAT family N-acetyltransferase [Micromonospora halophytica]SCG64522.1 FR47-like protein [Micromonospora halophytica]